LPSLSPIPIIKSSSETLAHLEWQQAMIDDMCALQSSGTWEFIPFNT